MIFAIDFDGTCVKHEYPRVGEDCPEAVKVLKDLVAKGHELVLFTMRSGEQLADAVSWFKLRDIPLSGVQYSKGQTEWTSSNKCFANVYIDDAALGCPLKPDPRDNGCFGKPFVDWVKVRTLLENEGHLN